MLDVRCSMLMPNKSPRCVSNPPPKPLLIWDGECHFCRLWIERWREITEGKVDYATYQEAAGRFPEIPAINFTRTLVFIKPDGDVFFAADAVYQSLAYHRSRRWLAWSYDRVPGFAAVSETGYGFIARHRTFASAITRFFWGKDVRRPTYFWARRWFLRALWHNLSDRIRVALGAGGRASGQRRHVAGRISFCRQFTHKSDETLTLCLPTLCWFNSSNAFLHFLCGSGVLFSLLLIFGIAPAISLVALFVLYLSLTIAGQIFFNFQWDVLLLGDWFLIDLLCAVATVATGERWFASRPGSSDPGYSSRFHALRLFLLKLLLFKLMLMSGVVKLTSGDAELVEPHRPRLSLLVATVADGVRLVGGQKSGMVQAFFCGFLPRGRNYRAVFHLGATTPEAKCRRTADFSPTCDRDYGQLLLFQSAHDRVVLVAHRRCIDRASFGGTSSREPGIGANPALQISNQSCLDFHLRRRDCPRCDACQSMCG